MFLTIIIFLIIVLLGIIYGTIKMFFSKKKWVKIIACGSSLAIIFLLFSIYRAFYPSTDFYIEEWSYSTNLAYPESANIIWKNATYPDQHGDYTASAIIEMSAKDFIKLHNSVKNNKVFKIDTQTNGYNGIIEQYLPLEKMNNFKFKDYYFSSLNKYFKIGFDSNNNTVIFQRHSS